jgi:DNA repair photolyase
MFPSSHDIFDDYIDDYINTVMKIIDAGHTVLVVTKPNMSCISKMISAFKNHKNKLLFRLTITTDNPDIVKYYEPNASSVDERINCLKLLFDNGFRTSVSIEPFLSSPESLVHLINNFVTDDIWIGVMSGLNINPEIDETHKNELNSLYDKNNLINIINNLKDNKKIFWKTSIMKIVVKH